MATNRINLDDFPDSAYAHELRRGLARLRFDAPLEAEYCAVHLQRVRLRVRIWFSLTFVLSVLFTVEQVRRMGFRDPASLAHLGALLPCTSALFWLVWSRHYGRFYQPASRVLVTVFCALISVFIARAVAGGREVELSGLAVNLIAVFFFAGLRFRQALVTAVIMLAAFTAAALAVGLPSAILLKSMVAMSLTSVIAAIVYHDVEQSYRRSFLENALIGELVARDGLSGLMNRRAFDEHLLRVWQHALRDQRSIAILMIDVDHFKRYNDDFGHQAGDLALRNVAQAVKGFARRPLDIAARYGGEEFAVILYDLAPEHVRDTAERLRESVERLKIRPSDAGAPMEPEAAVTVSVGVGLVAPTIGRTPQGAVQLADEALYEAKTAGRNRVVIKGEEAYVLLETGAFAARQNSGLPR
jgi:diguanylate cyclase (GGDEF)-like protein